MQDTSSFDPKSFDITLLDRYAAGMCTPEERLAVETFLAESSLHHDIVAAMQKVSAGGAAIDRQADLEHGWERFRAQLAISSTSRTLVSQPEVTHRAMWRPSEPEGRPLGSPQKTPWYRSGARFALTAGVAAALLVTGFFAASYFSPNVSAEALATYVTPPGERAKIELTDGTVISLNVASRVEIPRNFGARNRTVRLWGEAHFNVVHNMGAPFTVSAGALRATVLGTEFGVRAYRQDAMQVAVRTGKVAVNDAVVGANEVARTDERGAVTVSRAQDVTSILGFAAGRLVLSDIPLRDAVDDLNRWYDVEIRFGDRALEDHHIRAVLAPGSAGDLMDILQLMFDVRVVRDGRTLTLYSK